MMLDKLKKFSAAILLSAVVLMPFANSVKAASPVVTFNNIAVANDAYGFYKSGQTIAFKDDYNVSLSYTLNGVYHHLDWNDGEAGTNDFFNSGTVFNGIAGVPAGTGYHLTFQHNHTSDPVFKYNFEFDYTAPVITVNGISNNQLTNQAPTITFSATEGTPSATLSNKTTNTIEKIGTGKVVTADGFYHLSVTSTDRAGNSANKSLYFTIDRTAPVITISGVTDGESYNGNVNASFTTNEGSVTGSLNGASYTSGSAITADGNYKLIVTATDSAGNISAKSVSFIIDRSNKNKKHNDKTTTKIVQASNTNTTTTLTTATDAELSNITITDIYNVGDAGGNADACDNVTIVGKAKEGLLIILYLKQDGSDTPVIGFVKATAGDRFEFTTNEPLADGNYTIFAKAAVEGGITGPLLELSKFSVNDCQVNYIWLWLLIILALILLALIIAWLSTRNKEEREEEVEGTNYRSRI